MRYQKTVNLWIDNNADKLRTGKLQLQSGQWVLCSTDSTDIKSRFVCVAGLSVVVAHGHTNTEVNKRYRALLEAYKHYVR
tara:strand:+ start:296 stop:535 length:240 start_codon:yes stop_codon:yes gene_type:complete